MALSNARDLRLGKSRNVWALFGAHEGTATVDLSQGDAHVSTRFRCRTSPQNVMRAPN
jgi:hypothetical protein